jgi:dephospho-CoA kinase
MKKRLVLGITGGIASGKSTAMRILAGRGIPGISSDDLAHACIRRGRPAYRAILRRFGRAVLLPNGQINRRKLGEIVFANPKERKALEKMVHPCVIKGLKNFIERHHKGVVALDIPLLFESGLKHLVNKMVVVYCTRSQQMVRLRRRTGLSRDQALARLRAQMPLNQKCRKADWIWNNTRSTAHLRKQIADCLPGKKA